MTTVDLDDPVALRRLPEAELPAVADALRTELLHSVAASGGHLAAGLGTVELTIALHYVFDTPRDTLVWDVGHQAYPHKMLTGRRDQLARIRQRGGLSGFLRRDESPFDSFGAGHSSTSISAALGIALANQRLAPADTPAPQAVAIIGDGALTAGMAFEALHHAGGLGVDLLVVLNDNGMSISENVGALSRYLTRIGRDALAHGAEPPVSRDEAASARPSGEFFEALGFEYSGPIDGHDVLALVGRLREMRARGGPRLLHVITRKGAGYAPAEKDPIKYHGVTPFDPAVGIAGGSTAAPSYTQVFGDWVCQMAEHDPRLVVITPAMREGSGLVEFARRFPDRFFDVGIAEQHAVTLAAGMASAGLRPIVAIYSTFLQRGFDQLVHDVCLQRLPVTFAIDRGGLVGPDGATHHGSLDLAYLRALSGLCVMTPSDASQLRAMLRTGLNSEGPVAIRYPRAIAREPNTSPRLVTGDTLAPGLPQALERGRGEWLRRGSGIALLCFGSLLERALELADIIDASVADMRFVKPLDGALIEQLANSHELLVTLEENVVHGGAGSAVIEHLAAAGRDTAVLTLGLPDQLIEHGTRDECLREAGLDLQGLFESIARYAALLPETRPALRRQLTLSRNTLFNGVTRSIARSKLR
ncbi:MAG: 1-deoxy-D-xylulose-5-phosphate synthase [Steroidobacteraceae bacterium]